MQNLITVILLTHREKFFERALNSIIESQKKSKLNYNLIINCDCQKNYLKNYLKRIFDNFKNIQMFYITTKENSINDIYINAIGNVTTEYFYILEDDDELLTNFNFLLKYRESSWK
jgi:hypothetical protein